MSIPKPPVKKLDQDKINSVCEKLLDKYGEKQLIIGIEELSELIKAITKALRGNFDIENITEEVADVFIIIEQLKLYFNIGENELNEVIEFKINRTKEKYL